MGAKGAKPDHRLRPFASAFVGMHLCLAIGPVQVTIAQQLCLALAK